MVDTSSVTANGDHPSMAGDDADKSSTLENRTILSRDGERRLWKEKVNMPSRATPPCYHKAKSPNKQLLFRNYQIMIPEKLSKTRTMPVASSAKIPSCRMKKSTMS
jgi:hypothetical protein